MNLWVGLFTTPKQTLNPAIYPPLEDERFVELASAGNFVLALTVDCRLLEFGWTDRSTEGHSDKRETLIPHRVRIPFGWVPLQMVGGHVHALVLCRNRKKQKKIFSWGFNQQGQLGLGDLDARHEPTQVDQLPENICHFAAGEFHNLVLTDDGKVFAWGKNDYGQCGVDPKIEKFVKVPAGVKFEKLENEEKIVKVGCGADHSLAVTSKGRLFTWGSGCEYRRVSGNEDNIYEPEALTSINVPKTYLCKEAYAGSTHTLLVTQRRIIQEI